MSPRIMHIDTNTGATISATPSPNLRSDEVVFEPTIEGELQRLRQDFDKHCADYAANQAAQEQREKIAERKRAWFGIVLNTVSAIIGGLIVSYWPSIIAFLGKIFH